MLGMPGAVVPLPFGPDSPDDQLVVKIIYMAAIGARRPQVTPPRSSPYSSHCVTVTEVAGETAGAQTVRPPAPPSRPDDSGWSIQVAAVLVRDGLDEPSFEPPPVRPDRVPNARDHEDVGHNVT